MLSNKVGLSGPTIKLVAVRMVYQVRRAISSVDRMERGAQNKTAIQEIYDEFGITTYPIVTVREILDTLHNVPVYGKVVIDDAMKARMEAYLEEYYVK